MREIELDLDIGDVVQIGDHVYTVIDIENGEVCFRIDPVDEFLPAYETARPGK